MINKQGIKRMRMVGVMVRPSRSTPPEKFPHIYRRQDVPSACVETNACPCWNKMLLLGSYYYYTTITTATTTTTTTTTTTITTTTNNVILYCARIFHCDSEFGDHSHRPTQS
jgi:hypothetical protein